MNQRLEYESVEIFDLHKQIEALERNKAQLETTNGQLNEKINQLQGKTDALAVSVDDLDQYSRNSNLLVHGVPSISTGQQEVGLARHVVQLLNTHMGTSLVETDLVAVHRLARHGATAPTLTQKPQPILIQFGSKNNRNSTLASRKHLKGKGISVTEHLTTRRSQLLKRCSELVTQGKIEGAWSHDGKILVKTPTHRTIVIGNDRDLSAF